MRRLTFGAFRQSRGPAAIGINAGDSPRLAQVVNAAVERLVYCKEANEEGWSGGWAEMAFSVDRCKPHITLPYGVARLEAIDVLGTPVPLRNQFWEYLLFGNGRLPKCGRWQQRNDCITSGYSRNNAITTLDLSNPPQTIMVVITNPADVGKRILIQGLDQNGRQVYSQDNNANVQGEFITFTEAGPYSANTYSELTGIQKDVTIGEVQIWQSDPIWGVQELLLTMEPGETTAWYKRYYLNALPRGCASFNKPCPAPANPGYPYPPKEWVLVTGLVKLDLVSVMYDTDYLLIQSLEAIIAECQSVRYSEMDDGLSTQKSAERHQAAIRLLIGEIQHFEGKNNPSIQFRPFGNAGLERRDIAMK